MIIPIRAIPKFKNKETTHSDMADNKDIRNAIFGAVPEANEQVKEFAKYFGRNSQRESCKAIFDFLKHKIKYVADADLQLIKLPSALLHTKVGDCKSYSLLTSAILTNLGIPHHFVLVSYNNDPTPSHIYVETDDGCIIDAVWGIFDSEKKPTYKYKVKPNGKMKVKSITGTGKASTFIGANCGCGCPSCRMTGYDSIGKIKLRNPIKQAVNWTKEQADEAARKARELAAKAEAEARAAAEKAKAEAERLRKEAETLKGKIDAGWDKFKTWSIDKAKDILGKAKTIGLAGGRNLILIIVKNNLDGLANKFSRINQGELRSAWNKAGGNWTDLQNAIKKGASKPYKNLGLLKGIEKIVKTTGLGQTEPPPADFNQLLTLLSDPKIQAAIVSLSGTIGTGVGAAAGASTGPGAAATAAGGGTAGASMGAVLNAMAKILPALLSLLSSRDRANPDPIGTNTDFSQDDSNTDESGNDTSTTTPYIIGAAVVAGLALFYFSKPKKS